MSKKTKSLLISLPILISGTLLSQRCLEEVDAAEAISTATITLNDKSSAVGTITSDISYHIYANTGVNATYTSSFGFKMKGNSTGSTNAGYLEINSPTAKICKVTLTGYVPSIAHAYWVVDEINDSSTYIFGDLNTSINDLYATNVKYKVNDDDPTYIKTITVEYTSNAEVAFQSYETKGSLALSYSYSSGTYTASSATLKFGLCLTKDLYDGLNIASVGVAYKYDSSDYTLYACTGAFVESKFASVETTENIKYYQYFLSFAGIQQDDFDKEITAYAYVITTDSKTLVTTAKTYSVKSICAEYVSKYATDASVAPHKDALTAFSK